MKYVILRCEDGGRGSGRAAPLLEGAKAAFLQQLAQAGAAGVVRRHAAQRLATHRGLLGLAPQGIEPPAGQCYAVSASLALAEGERVWCCDFATEQAGRVVDPTAGQITTKESAVLIQALNMALGSETRRWEVGSGNHHLLVTRDPALTPDSKAAIPSPELLVGESWATRLPRHPLADAVRLMAQQARDVLEPHPINQVRVDLGQNPANFMWLWGGAQAAASPSFKERTGLSGAVVSHSFPLRGLAKTLALEWKAGPAMLDEVSVDRLSKEVVQLLKSHDLVYVHVRIISDDPVERLCAVDRLDQRLLRPLAEALPKIGPWRLLAAIDDRADGSVAFIAVGDGLPQQPVAQVHERGVQESPLQFADSGELFAWFTRQAG
ncbi:MAG: hypothetical protein HY598_04755 [Candidatus Omnitrophica bacterium]|nr:hypothetical protein [Candidatus Omnitrophota bacterium]